MSATLDVLDDVVSTHSQALRVMSALVAIRDPKTLDSSTLWLPMAEDSRRSPGSDASEAGKRCSHQSAVPAEELEASHPTRFKSGSANGAKVKD